MEGGKGQEWGEEGHSKRERRNSKRKAVGRVEERRFRRQGTRIRHIVATDRAGVHEMP